MPPPETERLSLTEVACRHGTHSANSIAGVIASNASPRLQLSSSRSARMVMLQVPAREPHCRLAIGPATTSMANPM